MDWDDGVNLINKAFEKVREQREWEMWISIYPNMTKENFISFEKFRSKNINNGNSSNKSLTDKEILEKMEELRMVHQGIHPGIIRE